MDRTVYWVLDDYADRFRVEPDGPFDVAYRSAEAAVNAAEAVLRGVDLRNMRRPETPASNADVELAPDPISALIAKEGNGCVTLSVAWLVRVVQRRKETKTTVGPDGAEYTRVVATETVVEDWKPLTRRVRSAFVNEDERVTTQISIGIVRRELKWADEPAEETR